MNKASRLRLIAALPLLAAATLSSGCFLRPLLNPILGSPEPEFIIPDQETAQKQYLFAESLRQFTTRSSEKETREQQMEKIIALYEAVEERFPEDTVYTPQAKLKLGMLWQRSPGRESKLKAIEYFQECQQRYAQNDHILAYSLYEEGLALDTLSQFENAQAKYREVFTLFGKADDEELRKLSNEARARYNKVHTRAKSAIF